MCNLAGIGHDARCYCINPPAPTVVFIILKMLLPSVGSALLCRGNFTALAQDVTQHGLLAWLLMCLWTYECVCVCMSVCGCLQLLSSSWHFQPSETCPSSYFLLFCETIKLKLTLRAWNQFYMRFLKTIYNLNFIKNKNKKVIYCHSTHNSTDSTVNTAAVTNNE